MKFVNGIDIQLNKRVLERDRYICQGCLKNKATMVYRKRQTSTADLAFEMTSLCNQCFDEMNWYPSRFNDQIDAAMVKEAGK